MFDGFEVKRDADARRRWFASAGTSAAVYLLLGGIVAAVAGKTVARRVMNDQFDVTFRAEIEAPPPEEAPPPPPPPPPAVKKKVASATLKPGRPLTEPTRITDERAEDVADGEEIDPETLGEGGTAEPPAPPPAPPPPEREVVRPVEPQDVADDLELAVALPGNRAPLYPAVARKRGQEGEVLLKVMISEAGEVIDVVVLGGAEPFVTAALAAVKTWRYRPARESGRATAGSRIVRIPFRIRV